MPSRTGNILKSALGGGLTGWSVGGPIGAGVGALLGGILGGTEKTEEEIMQERMARFLQRVREKKAQTLKEGKELIGQQIGTAVGTQLARAGRRAGATGRVTDVESYALPGQQQVYQRGSEALKDFILQTGRMYDPIEMEAEYGFATRPLPTPTSDYFLTIGKAAEEFRRGQEMTDILAGTPQIPGLDVEPPSIRTINPPQPAGLNAVAMARNRFRPQTVPLSRQLPIWQETGGVFPLSTGGW